MITAVVTFKLPPEMTREKWREHNKSVSPRFQKIPGLIRKQFLYDGKGTGGHVSVGESRGGGSLLQGSMERCCRRDRTQRAANRLVRDCRDRR